MASDVTADAETKLNLLPPYPAFQSVKSGIAVLKEHVIPNRIDRSIWGNKYSGSVATQVLTSFRFLGLINAEGTPTERLRALVKALDTEEWAAELRKVIEVAYAPIFELDLEKATVTQFYERFRDVYKAEGETSRKCVTFFLNAAREAAIKVSPFLSAGAKPRAAQTGRRRGKSKRDGEEGARDPGKSPPPSPPAPASVTDVLLAKFPEFDPSWPDEIKTQWFSGFSELMNRAKT